MKKMLFAAAALLTMTACGGGQALTDVTWKLAEMKGIPAEAIEREADFFTLTFSSSDMTMSGRTNCNRFFGKYELDGRELDLEGMGMTRMACPEMQYEDAFVEMLDEVDAYRIEGGELLLLDDGRVLARFRAMPAAAAAE